MASTEIDTAAVRDAGTDYTAVAAELDASARRLRAFTAGPESFGQRYRQSAQRYAAAMRTLGDAVEAWRDGSRAAGTALIASAAAHHPTDSDGAHTVAGA